MPPPFSFPAIATTTCFAPIRKGGGEKEEGEKKGSYVNSLILVHKKERKATKCYMCSGNKIFFFLNCASYSHCFAPFPPQKKYDRSFF